MLWIQNRLWLKLLSELSRRSNGIQESGVFLLGTVAGRNRVVTSFVAYDDVQGRLAPRSISLPSDAYPGLWAICRERGARVVADMHCHPGQAYQSETDAAHPMIPEIGHVSLIVPNYAQAIPDPDTLGIYEYLGNLDWRDWSGPHWNRFLTISNSKNGNS